MCSPAVVSMLFCMVVVVAAPWPLVGREGELTRIAAAVSHAAPGGVLLTGPAGMGRSRLARECTAIGAAAGFACERILATPSLSGLPLGSLAPLLPPVPPDIERRGDLVGWAVDAILADRERLFLVVDDAHLLDETSAEVVHRLVRAEATFVVITVRRGALASSTVNALQTDHLLERIDIEPLSRKDLDSLIDGVLGGWVDGITRHDLWEYSGGSPQLLRELVLAALDAGALRKNDGVWHLGNEWALAPRLVDLVSTRMAGLATEERDLLDLLALAGPLEPRTIDRLGMTRQTTAALRHHDLISTCPAPGTLGSSHRGDLVTAGERVGLAHPLHGQVLRAGLGTIGRAAATRRLAAAGIHLTSDLPTRTRDIPETDILDADAVVAGYDNAVSERDRFGQAWFAFLRGRRGLLTGDLVTAGGWFTEAATVFGELGESLHRQRCLAGRVVAAAQRGDTEDLATAVTSLDADVPSQAPLRPLTTQQETAPSEAPSRRLMGQRDWQRHERDGEAAEVVHAKAWAAMSGGEPALARALLVEAAEAAEAGGAVWVAVEAWHDLARLGDPAPAAAALARLGDPGSAAAALARLGDPGSAAAALARGERVAAGGLAWGWGELEELFGVHAAGLAAGDPVVLGDVADRFEEIGAVLFAAEAAAAASAGHLRRRDRRAVRRLAGHAAALAERCQAATPALLLAGPAAALTAREHEIATLAARGLASKTIAGRIGIGVRTVECHLQRAYQKLGVNNRSDLASALAA